MCWDGPLVWMELECNESRAKSSSWHLPWGTEGRWGVKPSEPPSLLHWRAPSWAMEQVTAWRGTCCKSQHDVERAVSHSTTEITLCLPKTMIKCSIISQHLLQIRKCQYMTQATLNPPGMVLLTFIGCIEKWNWIHKKKKKKDYVDGMCLWLELVSYL